MLIPGNHFINLVHCCIVVTFAVIVFLSFLLKLRDVVYVIQLVQIVLPLEVKKTRRNFCIPLRFHGRTIHSSATNSAGFFRCNELVLADWYFDCSTFLIDTLAS